MTDRSDTGDPDGAILSRPARRRFLRTLLNVGFGAGVASALTPGQLLSDEATIVYGLAWRGRSEPERLRTDVPRAWYEGLRRSFDVQSLVVDANFPGIVGTFVVPGTYDDPAPRLDVDVTPALRSLSDLEDLLADVEYTIEFVQPSDPELSPGSIDEERGHRVGLTGTRVPAGALCTDGEKEGTLAPALDANGRQFFVTSNHIYGAEGTLETEHRGEPLYLRHREGTTRIGTVVQGFPEEDIVLAEPDDPYSPASTIATPLPTQAVGHFTMAGLADLYARGESLEKVGAISGHTSGEIKGINGVTCYYGGLCRRGQLKWGSKETMTDGDSGSISYHPDPERPGQVLVGGVNNARTWWPGGDFTWGAGAHHIYDRHGYHF